MSYEEYKVRKERIEAFEAKKGESDLTEEMQHQLDCAWINGYNAGKEEIIDKIDGLLTNMNNKISVEEK